MNKFLLVVFCLFSLITFSQTKEETQEWIKEKIEMYGSKTSWVNNYTVKFSGGNMIIINNSSFEGSFFVDTVAIPIKQLGKIRFEEKTDKIVMKIPIKDKSYSISTVSESGIKIMVNETKVILDKSIDDEDLRARLIKSFDHLITLYGGTVVKEVF